METNAIEYRIQGQGTWAKKRKPQFYTRGIGRVRGELGEEERAGYDAHAKERAAVLLAEVRFSGKWTLVRQPITLTRYEDGTEVVAYLLGSGERIDAGVL